MSEGDRADRTLTTVKALHVWLIETTQCRPARIDELSGAAGSAFGADHCVARSYRFLWR